MIQELEQQALEQYRTAGSTESINESGHLDQRNDVEEKIDNVNDDDNEDNTGDRCSSGFGKCNSPDRVDDEKGSIFSCLMYIKLFNMK